ncbi:MAG: T9SS type A sorting domain-containing protein [Crocinitomicaceae bacterium]|nr:T9SS type A sorting domain-containing protein [Crocinitomicaceae bacterium]
MNQLISYTVAILLSLPGLCQVTPPCGLDYGTATDEFNIIQQMRYGNINTAINAIQTGMNSRGNSLGCPQVPYGYISANTLEPLLSDIVNVWSSAHAPTVSNYNVSCPRIGRYESNSTLGAYYAMLAGYFSDTSKLAEISDMMYDQQYAVWNINSPDARNEGVFGYINVPNIDPCFPGGVVGASVDAICSALPMYCQTYTTGQFAGENFLFSGQDDANNWFDGGLAYDHGWVGVQMIESAIQQNDPILKEKYRNSVELAAQYCISEFSVKNHNYTAKLIWLLAQMYAWTGNPIYANELNYKLDKNLIPGILWDETNDGIVDGTSPQINFSNLTPVAQEPGRMWDGHNSLPWYHAINTSALTEAYVAFRDQGDLVRANELKPYVIAMVDNLANEIVNQGVVAPDQLGVRDITYSLLTAIWKLSQYETESHPNWESAAWAMWNSGYFNSYSTHSVCVGLFLLVKSNTPYTPLFLREAFELSVSDLGNNHSIRIFPNPGSNVINIETSGADPAIFAIYNTTGKVLLKGKLTSGKINLEALDHGTYFLFINEKYRGRFVKM